MEVGLQLQVVFPRKEGGNTGEATRGVNTLGATCYMEGSATATAIRADLAWNISDGRRATRQAAVSHWAQDIRFTSNEEIQLSKYLECKQALVIFKCMLHKMHIHAYIHHTKTN